MALGETELGLGIGGAARLIFPLPDSVYEMLWVKVSLLE